LRSGFTLVEMLIVIGILVAITGIVVVVVGDTLSTAQDVTTKTTLEAVRAAIVGTTTVPGFISDVGRNPSSITDLLVCPSYTSEGNPPLHWRGPYLTSSGGRFPNPTLADSITRRFSTFNTIWFVVPDGKALYGGNDTTPGTLDPAILDAWGNPVVLQVPNWGLYKAVEPDPLDWKYARIVSAGPDGIIQIPSLDAASTAPDHARLPYVSECGDDIVLYLKVADIRPAHP